MQESLVSRLTGIVTFKAPVYKEVADDPAALTPALIIVIVVAVLVGLIGGLIGNTLVFSLVVTVVSQLITWLLGSWLLAFIAKLFFKGNATTSSMLRIMGHTAIFQILGVIPVIGIIGGILQAVANVIGVREANGFDTTKAILTVIIEFVVVLVITGIIVGVVTAAILLPTMMNQ
jgi:hypothetical protein